MHNKGFERTFWPCKTPVLLNRRLAPDRQTNFKVMLALFLLLFLICPHLQCRRLTTEENELNSIKCGVHFLGQPVQGNRLVKKSYGGREFEENEYPWTAVLLKNGQAYCSGVQISPRHILTAAHCVLAFDEIERMELCRMNQSQSIVSYMDMPENILVAIGGEKVNCNSFPCQYNKNLYRAKKITTKEMSMCDLKEDLALIELSQNILENDSTAICMPKDDLQPDRVLYASGIGIDPSSPITFENQNGEQAHGQQVVALRYHAVDQLLHQIETVTFAKGTCSGDSGGPLFQVNEEGRHILVGINSSKVRNCKQHNENMINYFTDVRANLDWICKYSGVCPLEEELW
ncbi:unnamed protein product [Cylicocyclus nassatus]|uniref:Peptidase S1 domain-containing protein n=1 Tax=Cylicocyclus nassatus TaxID=53992 RepID=A0AA36MER4_CYLNA|nr:unnamed protein product [Cylicocyclus nassatus]